MRERGATRLLEEVWFLHERLREIRPPGNIGRLEP
jgi:hypothetical protein